MLYWISNRDLR